MPVDLPTTQNSITPPLQLSPWCWPISLFLLGLAAKLYLIFNFALPAPIEDQWDGEALAVYVPYFHHQLSLHDLIAPHNEHRIFFTRIYDLALLLLNGQWDNQLQTVVNAIIHCAVLAGFGCLLAKWLGQKVWPLIWLPLALMLVVPFDWENTLEGFQSQFYFLLLGSLLAIRWLGLCAPFSPRWCFGAIIAFATLFTMAAGSLTALAIVAMSVLEIVKDRTAWKRHLPTISIAAAIAILGICITPVVPRHEILRAQSIAEFLEALGKNLSWPCTYFPWLALLNLAGPALLAWFYLRSRGKNSDAERMVLGLVIWVVLQSMAMAYSRGVGGKPPASRYQDLSSFVMLLNWLCIILIWTRHRAQLPFADWAQGAVGAWALCCIASLGYTAYITVNEGFAAFAWAKTSRIQNTRAFVLTGDPNSLVGKPVFEIPFPYPDQLIECLQKPELRRILPACIREPLPVTPKKNTDQYFRENAWPPELSAPGEKGWSSAPLQSATIPGDFESLPIKASSFPFLEIPVAGDLGLPGLSLQLVELATGKTTEVRPAQIPGLHWVNIDVRAPRGDFKIIAHSTSPNAWFAFQPPREMARLSAWSTRLAAAWQWLLLPGLACLLLPIITNSKEFFTGGKQR